jgi:phosphate-selective porin
LRYQSLQEPGKPDGFDIRKARLDIKGNFSPEWEYRLQTDFAVSPKIIDAYFAYKPYDGFKITGGQFLIPNSLESTTSDNALETIDRSQVVGLVERNKDAIGDQNGRDIGLQVSGSIFKTSSSRFLLDYYLGYFNGQGINKGDLNESKDIAARLVAHPTTFLDFGVSYSNGYDNWETKAAKAATYTGNVLTTAPTNAINTNNVQNRIGADVSINYNSFTFRAEYLQAQQLTIKKDGWYVQAGYFVIPTKLQFVAKYDSFDKDINIAKNTTDFLTLGTNYYVNSFTKIQLNYKHYSDNFAVASGNKDEIVAQLQLKF